MRKLVVSLLLGVAMLFSCQQPARAQDVLTEIKNLIFGDEVEEEGIVNYVQPSWFTIMHDGTFTRIQLPPGKRVPFDMQVGNMVKVVCKPDNYGNFYMVEVEKLQDSVPLPPPTPGR